MNFLVELFGENNTGKTHAAYDGFPDPIMLDTAFTEMGFRELEVKVDEDGKGESWANVLKLNDWDPEEARQDYCYIESFGEFRTLRQAGVFDGYETIIIDNSRDMRVLAAKEWVEENDSEWPQRQEWGEINDKVNEMFETLNRTHHVVVISQMTDEYEDGEKTGQRVYDGPNRMDYKADFRFEAVIEDGERRFVTRKNRFLDRTGDLWFEAIEGDFDFEEVLALTEIPPEHW